MTIQAIHESDKQRTTPICAEINDYPNNMEIARRRRCFFTFVKEIKLQ